MVVCYLRFFPLFVEVATDPPVHSLFVQPSILSPEVSRSRLVSCNIDFTLTVLTTMDDVP